MPPPRKPFDLHAKGDAPFKRTSYGPLLAKNKARVWHMVNACRLTYEQKRLCIAVAMCETNHMALSERDTTRTGASENVSIFNINVDMLNRLNFPYTKEQLNAEEGLPNAIRAIQRAVNAWGAKRFLDFHRGGFTGFMDGRSFGCYQYRNAIATIMPLLREDLQLASANDTRIEIQVDHLSDESKP